MLYLSSGGILPAELGSKTVVFETGLRHIPLIKQTV
jgi:hypothetical protein